MPHSSRSLLVAGLIGALTLTACGGSSDDSAADTTSATTAETVAPSTTAPDTTVAETDAPTTLPPAPFEGPGFVETVEPVLAPYMAAIGQPGTAATVASLLPAVTPDVPMPANLTLTGVGRSWEQSDPTTVEDTQSMAFGEGLDSAALEAFGATAGADWRAASFATSGSLSTLLLTHTDGRRAVYVAESDPAGTYAPLGLEVEPSAATIAAPVWAAALPALEGGTLIDVTEAAGRVQSNLFGTEQFVAIRWRYAASELDALRTYLESGVVQSAGFTYDVDVFNGFENMVDVTIGDWSGTVIIGEANIDGETFYDLVWSLGR